MRRSLGLLAAVVAWDFSVAVAQDRAPTRTVEDGILDEIRLYADKLPAVSHVVIRPFSATDEDLVEGDRHKDETKKMQVDAPPMLSREFVTKLKEFGPFTDVSALEADAAAPADSLVVEGKFIEMDPGSRAKRYFVGFGAGKSGVTVEGAVKAADGTVLATFKQRRVGVMGVAGGSSMGKLTADTKNIAEDVAKFMSAWAKGKSLK